MEDKELLEFAAKAAGIRGHFGLRGSTSNFWLENNDGESIGKQWNPRTDDGDALRLAVKLGIQVTPYPIYEEHKHSVLARKCRLGREDNGIGEPETASIEWIELYGGDPSAATRLAVLRVAAEIGKAMQ